MNGPVLYAFGHPLDGAGRRSLFLQDAYVDGIVPITNSPLGASYKLLAPGHTEGTLTSDAPNAVIGVTGAPPASIPVEVTAHDLDTGQSMSLQTQVADETDVGLPLGTSLVGSVAPLEIGQAALSIFNGAPSNESGSMCLRIYVREIKGGPLGLCDRYAGSGPPGGYGINELGYATMSDAGIAFSYLEQEQFANLHVTKVLATVDARRGLDQAEIISATAPKHVKAGQRVTVKLTLRLYRGRLEHVSFKVRIPRHARGILIAQIAGGGSGFGLVGPGGLAGLLGQLIGGSKSGYGGGPSGPGSPRALRQDIASIAQYPGVVFEFARQRPKDVYASKAFIVTGFAQLKFVVGKVLHGSSCPKVKGIAAPCQVTTPAGNGSSTGNFLGQ